MILVKLRGGLANQMFQYAAARRLAGVHGTGVRIDTGYYDRPRERATPRAYELDRLAISGERASRWETIGTDGVRSTPPHELPVALARKLRPRYRFVAERHFHFDPAILDLPDRVCLFGYWISERYFADAAETIRREFRFASPPSEANAALLAELAERESVAVHVRRGDYLHAQHAALGLCGVDYYERAARFVRERVADPAFYVFSDDLDWARSALGFLGPDTTFVGHNRGAASFEDLRLMAGARHNVIANSSFSWWGAWLGERPGKVVVAPDRWMADPALDTSDVVPERWARL